MRGKVAKRLRRQTITMGAPQSDNKYDRRKRGQYQRLKKEFYASKKV